MRLRSVAVFAFLAAVSIAPSATAHPHTANPSQMPDNLGDEPSPEQAQAVLFVQWGGTWWAAKPIGATKDGGTRIHYIGWSSSWDESVGKERMARRVEDGRIFVYRQGTWRAASILFKTNDGKLHVHFDDLPKEQDETVGASRVIRLG